MAACGAAFHLCRPPFEPLNTQAEQGLSLISTVRAHGTEAFEGARYAARLDPLLALQMRQGALYGGVRVVNGALNTCLVSAILLLGGALAAAGVLPRSDLTAFVLYTEFISSASADVADQWTRVQEALGSASEVFSLLERGKVEPLAESAILAALQLANLPSWGQHSATLCRPLATLRT